MKMKDLIAELLESGLSQPRQTRPPRTGMNCPIPVTIPATGLKLKPLSNAEIEASLLQEDLEKIDIA